MKSETNLHDLHVLALVLIVCYGGPCVTIDLSLPPQLGKPRLFDIIREVRAPFEFASLALYVGALRKAPKGIGKPVILVPGYLADDYSMRPLGAYLQYLGYHVFYTEMGRNMGES